MKTPETFQTVLKEPQGAETPRRKVLTVSQLNREVRSLLESQFASIWVEGEISNFKRHTSGHMYFTLKDEQSQIGAVFFSRQNQHLKFELKDGLKVLVIGRISLYEPRGQYQLYVEQIEPKGLGSLQLAFLQLKEKLEKEGLFDPAHKKAIPRFPRVVGLVTSPTGAAIRDILNVINRRFCGTHMLLFPVRVQGDGAAQEIADAVDEMNRLGGMDVLIVGRGGGSLEDLWAFNEEIVARAIYRSRIPVISAVGHEIDWTICDLVSDLRAPTPSAAAELVVESREELEKRISDYQLRMRGAAMNVMKSYREQIETLSSSYAFKHPMRLVDQYAERVDEMLRQLQNYSKSLIISKAQAFEMLAGKLNALSPLAILGRGYSLTFSPEGKLLKDARKLKTGDTITTRLAQGQLRSEIVEILNPDPKGDNHD